LVQLRRIKSNLLWPKSYSSSRTASVWPSAHRGKGKQFLGPLLGDRDASSAGSNPPHGQSETCPGRWRFAPVPSPLVRGPRPCDLCTSTEKGVRLMVEIGLAVRDKAAVISASIAARSVRSAVFSGQSPRETPSHFSLRRIVPELARHSAQVVGSAIFSEVLSFELVVELVLGFLAERHAGKVCPKNGQQSSEERAELSLEIIAAHNTVAFPAPAESRRGMTRQPISDGSSQFAQNALPVEVVRYCPEPRVLGSWDHSSI